jgi:hypothetical protein
VPRQPAAIYPSGPLPNLTHTATNPLIGSRHRIGRPFPPIRHFRTIASARTERSGRLGLGDPYLGALRESSIPSAATAMRWSRRCKINCRDRSPVVSTNLGRPTEPYPHSQDLLRATVGLEGPMTMRSPAPKFVSSGLTSEKPAEMAKVGHESSGFAKTTRRHVKQMG